MTTIRTRVIAHVLREPGELLVLEGPSGIVVPGGAVEPGERLEDAAVREVEEETGLAVEIVRKLGVAREPGSFEPDFFHESHYFQAVAAVGAPDSWKHVVTGSGGENGTRVRCRFVPLDPHLALLGGRGRYLSSL